MVGRLDIAPRLEIPIVRGAAVSWSHSVGLRETLYTHRAGSGAGAGRLNRFVFDYGFELSGPRFARDFGPWTHVIEPEIAYRYRAGVDEFADTFRVDETDLLTNTHEVRYGITNRVLGDREILSWSLAQKYFLDPEFGGALEAGRDNVFEPLLDLTGFGFADRSRRFSPIVSVVRFAPDANRVADLQVDYDPTRRMFRSTGLIGRYRTGLTYYNVAYFRTSETPIQIASDQVRATLGYGDTERIGFNGSLNFSYNIDESILQTTTARLSYNTECYGLHLEFSQFDVGSRKESRFRFAFSLTDLGSIGTLRRSDQFF
jgi:LPS-assembly protein